MFGVGNDAAPEWKALGIDTRGRGARSNEMLALLARLWSEDHVSHEGKYYHYDDVTIAPKPKQNPLPLWIGGSSEAAIDRTARYGNGWLAGAAQGPEQISRVVASIRERSAELGRAIDEDHYGAGFAFRFGSWEEPAVERSVQTYRARAGADADPRNFMAVGEADSIIELVTRFREAGISKFVARPIASSDEEMMEQSRLLAEQVNPIVNLMA
jgi:alkanesulfonate monooxygenase SsuD/methylene tetrahydromethanopterin reductase-like flavin-dependent oxidoreductase (luciferase family)